MFFLYRHYRFCSSSNSIIFCQAYWNLLTVSSWQQKFSFMPFWAFRDVSCNWKITEKWSERVGCFMSRSLNYRVFASTSTYGLFGSIYSFISLLSSANFDIFYIETSGSNVTLNVDLHYLKSPRKLFYTPFFLLAFRVSYIDEWIVGYDTILCHFYFGAGARISSFYKCDDSSCLSFDLSCFWAKSGVLSLGGSCSPFCSDGSSFIRISGVLCLGEASLGD